MFQNVNVPDITLNSNRVLVFEIIDTLLFQLLRLCIILIGTSWLYCFESHFSSLTWLFVVWISKDMCLVLLATLKLEMLLNLSYYLYGNILLNFFDVWNYCKQQTIFIP